MRKRGRITLAVTVGAAALIAAAALLDPPPLLVWNASASAPIGLYRASFERPGRGDFVLLRLQGEAQGIAISRGYLPPNLPAIKRITAIPGDEICRRDSQVFINGRPVASALARDSLGRLMPVWRGCFTLVGDEFFVLNAHPASFDGRYFGAVSAAQIDAVAVLIWRRDEARDEATP